MTRPGRDSTGKSAHGALAARDGSEGAARRGPGGNTGFTRRMAFSIVSAVFPPEVVVSARTSGSIARALKRDGAAVTVIAPHPTRTSTAGAARAERRVGFHSDRDPEFGRVVRCPSCVPRRATLWGRLVEYVTFGISSSLAWLLAPRPDVAYVNSWPLFGAGALVLAARVRRVPVVLSIQDVYPESLCAQGRLEPASLAVRILRWMDGVIARAATEIIVLGPTFKGLYRDGRGVAENRIHVIPNWLEGSTKQAREDARQRIRREHGIPEQAFLAVFGGNVGAASGTETVVEAWKELRHIEDCYLLVAGSGELLDPCRDFAAKAGLGRVRFRSPWLADDTADVLAAADVLVLPTRAAQAWASQPSKMISYMLSGRPLIVGAPEGSDLAAVVRLAECGLVVEASNRSALADAIRRMKALDAEARATMGRAGKKYALDHFTEEACLPAVVGVLKSAMDRARRTKGDPCVADGA